MESEILYAKSLGSRELTRAPIWLKFLLFVIITSGMAMCVAGFLLLPGRT